jgi:alkylation response protein AidB-like acyl-CoA dehydrogenase
VQFRLSEDQRELQATVRSFMERTSSLPSVLTAIDAGRRYDEAVWGRIGGELDLIGLAVPEEYGGTGAGVSELCVVLGEMGRAMYTGPFFSSAVLAVTALLASDDEQAKGQYLPPLMRGQLLGTVVGPENGASTADHLSVNAHHNGSGWRLSGRATHVVDGDLADLLIVTARTRDGIECFLTESDAPGVGRTPQATIDATRSLAALTFEGAVADRMGSAGNGAVVLRRVVRSASVCLAWEQVGGAERCLDLAVEYAKQREQFGRPIGSFQAIKHRCARVLVATEAAKSAAMYAAWLSDRGDPDSDTAASVAKACCSDAFMEAAKTVIQVHGGIGFTWEHPAHLFLRRAASSRELLGSPASHRSRVADRIAVRG